MSFLSRLMGEIQMSAELRDVKPYDKLFTGSALREKERRAAGSNTDSNVKNNVSDNTKAANTSEGVGVSSKEKKAEAKTETKSEVKEEVKTEANMNGQNASPKTGTFMDELARAAGFVSNQQTPQAPPAEVSQMNAQPMVNGNPFAYATGVNPAAFGRHKVDNPQATVETQKVKKGDTVDQVNMDLPKLVVDVAPPKPPKDWPESVKQELPQVEVEAEKPVAVFDNTTITSKANCRYLKDIEKLALENGLQIQMAEQLSVINGQPIGLINCYIYTPESTSPNLLKCFTIDTGMMIDRRPKMIPVITQFGYEDYPMYYILTPKQDENGKKTKNVLNEELFKSMFVGGVKVLNPKDSMYTKDFMELNKYVALITMPTNNMSKDTRKEIQNRLMFAMKAGVFNSVTAHNGANRFIFSEYNKTDNSFVLRSGNVPLHYNSPVLSAVDKGLHFTFENGAPKTKVINF